MHIGGYKWVGGLCIAAFLAVSSPAEATDRKSERRALIFGDSQLYGEFGSAMHELMRARGYSVETHAVCSASSFTFLKDWETPCGYKVRRSTAAQSKPRTWYLNGKRKVPSIRALLKRRPEVVILVLGTNNGTTPHNARRFAQRLLRRIFAKSTVKRVYWVGPPTFRGEKDRLTPNLVRAIRTFDRAAFIDSRPFNTGKPLPRSHEHFGRMKARRWASWVFARMRSSLPNS